MITLALDEFGDFEGIDKEKHRPIGIAGILYDDLGNEKDSENERKRIREYYKECIRSVEERIGSNTRVEYPSALHSDGGKSRDHEVVRPIKRKVNFTLHNFLVNGTFDGHELLLEKRKGVYYVFCILKSEEGMFSRLENINNILTKDDFGSNLYFHMATEVVNRSILHNPLIENIDSVTFNIATRRTADIDSKSNLVHQYIQQGYEQNRSENPNHKKQVYFKIATIDMYRSVLAQEMVRSDKGNLSIEALDVTPIRYKVSASNMEFLYLADTVCTYLSDIKGTNANEWLTKVVIKANSINTAKRNLVFGYDSIDTEYQKAWESYKTGDYYRALSICSDARYRKGAFADHYNKVWFEHIRRLIASDSSELYFTKAVNELASTIKTNKYDPEKSIYILDTLEQMSKSVKSNLDDAESKAIIYTLYNTAVSAYCHIGNSKRALKYYNRCREYAKRVGVEEYLETLNRISETLLDNFEWKRAEKIAKESIIYQEKLIEMKNSLPVYKSDIYTSSIGLGKSYSQLGQVYAFTRNPLCEKTFRQALDIFETDSADYRITQSFLLHYYIDNGMKEEYIEESQKYFGGATKLNEQFDYIMEQGFEVTPIFNYKYALYAFLKGLYFFRFDEISESLINKLYSIDSTIKKAEIKSKGKKESTFIELNGHPSEFIYKYIAWIAMKKGDNETASLYTEKMNVCLKYKGTLLELISLNSQREYMRQFCENDGNKKLEAEMVQLIKDTYPTVLQRKAHIKNTENLDTLFTYMYH